MSGFSSLFMEKDGPGLSKIRIRPFRLLLGVVGILALLLLLSSPSNRNYIPLRQHSQPNDPVNVQIYPAVDPQSGRANATFVMLARNSDLLGVEESMREVEAAFNQEHNYPWTFLNEVPFTLDFKRRVRSFTKGDVHFGLIPNEQWYPPDWVDEDKYEHDRLEMQNAHKVPYAGSMPYRNMCRFNSGFFYRQPVLGQFKWYWRVEPQVKFPCKIPYDPFAFMIENNKRYAFTISIPEYMASIPTLWDHTKSFISENSELLPENNAYEWLTNDGGYNYNGCHFWSNFEIGDLDFFRSEAYAAFFDHLDASGNFFYERWGDAPVHSIGVALLLPIEQIHYFHDIGYYHVPFWNCPDTPLNSELKCTCQREQAFDSHGASCLEKFKKLTANLTVA